MSQTYTNESTRIGGKNTDIEKNLVNDVLYAKKGFVEKFHMLNFQQQLNVYQELIKYSQSTDSDDRCPTDASDKLDRIMESIGLYIVDRQDCFLSKEERLIIRMDFYGTIDRITQESERKRKLSKPYMDLIEKPIRKRPKMADYDFQSAPMWPLFTRFKSFRSIEKNLKRYLVINKINPQILSIMTVRDFSDLIARAFESTPEKLQLEDIKSVHQMSEKVKKYFAANHIDPEGLSAFHDTVVSKILKTKYSPGIKIPFEKPVSVRKRFVMSFIEEHEHEISDILLNQGYDKSYVSSIINAMKKYGATKTEKLVITETHFTDQILKDFTKAKINCKDFKTGDPIPQILIDYLILADRGDLVAARGTTGQKLCSSDFPSFEVHHKHAVSSSGDLSNIASINYKDNLCLVFTEIHNFILHGMDSISDNKRDAYSRLTEFQAEDIAFMGGFEQDKQIFCAYFDMPSRRKNDKEDSKNYTTYEGCLNRLEENQMQYEKQSKQAYLDSQAIAFESMMSGGRKKTSVKKVSAVSSKHPLYPQNILSHKLKKDNSR